MSTLDKVIETMRNQGNLTRNSGTHSIKSVKELLQEQFQTREQQDWQRTETLFDAVVESAPKFTGGLQTQAPENDNQTKGDLLEERRDLKAYQESTLAQLEAINLNTQGLSKLAGKGNTEKGGGIFAGLGLGAVGAGLGAFGAGLGAIATGLGAFVGAAPGLAVFTAFLAGIAGVSWLAGKGAQEIGQGLSDVSKGVDDLNEVGSRVNTDNLRASGQAINDFLGSINFFDNLGGAVVTRITGDLTQLADGVNTLNSIKVNKENLIAAGQGVNGFLSAMGEGSFFDKLLGGISTNFTGDMKGVAEGIAHLNTVAGDVNPQHWDNLAYGLSVAHKPLYELSKSGIAANLVGDEALSDLAKGITALNGAQVNNLPAVSQGIMSIDKGVWELTKTGLVANFVGSNALSELGDGVTYLNKTETSNLKRINEDVMALDSGLFELVKTGLAANFVGKDAISQLTDSIVDINTRLGDESNIEKSRNAMMQFEIMKNSLSSFATSNVWNSLKGVGASILDFFGGDNNPVDVIMKLGDQADSLERGANAVDKISVALERFSGIKVGNMNFDFEGMAEGLARSIPLLESLATGKPYDAGFLSKTIEFPEGGILSPTLKLDEVAVAVGKVQGILSGTGSTSIDNSSINTSNTTNNSTSTLVPSMQPVPVVVAGEIAPSGMIERNTVTDRSMMTERIREIDADNATARVMQNSSANVVTDASSNMVDNSQKTSVTIGGGGGMVTQDRTYDF